MSLAELVPMVQTLPREDKQRLAELLARDLNSEESSELLNSLANSRHEIWSQFNAFEAAETLLEVLRTSGAKG